MESFQDLTGELGSTLLAAVEERSSAGRFGTLFKDLKADRSTRTPSGQPEAAAATLGAGLTQRDPGDDGQDGLAGLPAIPLNLAPSGTGLGGAQASSRRTLAGQNLTGGLVFLGKGTLNELLEQMVQAEADGLFVFDIKASKNNRTGFVTNETRVRFLLSSGRSWLRPLGSSRILISSERDTGQAKRRGQKQIDQLFSRLDDILVLDEIPSCPSRRHSDIYMVCCMVANIRCGSWRKPNCYRPAGFSASTSCPPSSKWYWKATKANRWRGTAEDRKLVLDLVLSDL